MRTSDFYRANVANIVIQIYKDYCMDYISFSSFVCRSVMFSKDVLFCYPKNKSKLMCSKLNYILYHTNPFFYFAFQITSGAANV